MKRWLQRWTRLPAAAGWLAGGTICWASVAATVAATVESAAATPIEASAKNVYLTFDDGPDPVCTPLILSALRREHIHATFFVLGYRSERYPSLVRQLHQDGHEIGNHGYYHTFIVHKTKSWIERDVRRADAAIEAVSGTRPQYFRPPGGILSETDAGLVSKIGHPIAMWTVDTKDWKATSANSIIAAVKAGTRPGAIILMHDGIATSSHYTAQALPTIIRWLHTQGYVLTVLPHDFQGEFIGGHTDYTNRRFSQE